MDQTDYWDRHPCQLVLLYVALGVGAFVLCSIAGMGLAACYRGCM
jgi:hypothetical protein